MNNNEKERINMSRSFKKSGFVNCGNSIHGKKFANKKVRKSSIWSYGYFKKLYSSWDIHDVTLIINTSKSTFKRRDRRKMITSPSKLWRK